MGGQWICPLFCPIVYNAWRYNARPNLEGWIDERFLSGHFVRLLELRSARRMSAMRCLRVLKKAELPGHFTPHCLRHTYASLLLQQGESIVYVQRQLGHASIQLTVDTYGKWLPMGNKAAVDRLDYVTSGSKMVATSILATKTARCSIRTRSVYSSTSCGAGEWNRTTDLRFTKPLLCQLSYAGLAK